MLLFASLVFVMGESGWARWIYIVSGLIILNVANIFRLVLLFMHIQKHGTYVGVVDKHDLYDYVIYGIVFLLWVIWFEVSRMRSRARAYATPRHQSDPYSGQGS